MTTIDISTNPTLDSLHALIASGEEVALTDGDQLLAKLIPAKRRILGLLPGAFRMSDDFDAPLPDEFWLGEE